MRIAQVVVELRCPAAGSAAPTPGAPAKLVPPAPPLSDYALEFDGVDDFATIPNIGTMVQGDFSIAFWLKTNQVDGQDGQWFTGQGIVDGTSSGTPANDMGITVRNGKIAFGVGGPTNTTIRSNSVADDNWHFVVATRTQSTARFACLWTVRCKPVAPAAP